MRGGLAYCAAALCLGWVAVWGSELMFWITPPPGTTIPGLVLGWGLYSTAAAATLSTLLWSGLGGWRAAFLGGAFLGISIEGAAVSTMYDAFPVQLVWTPLAWHALITGLVITGGAFAATRGPLLQQVAGTFALGLFGAVWGLYWPLDHGQLASLPLMLAYLGLTGAGAVVALALLSRLPALPARGWWLWLAPAAIALLWVIGTVAAPSPLRLSGPVMAGLTVWAMRRLGGEGAAPTFGPPLPPGRLALLVLAPLTTALFAVAGWGTLGGKPVNIPIALVTGALGLGLWLWLLWRAFSRPSAALPRAR